MKKDAKIAPIDKAFDLLLEQLQQDEGFRQFPYDDATGKRVYPGDKVVGKMTVGYGRNIQDVPLALAELNLIGMPSQQSVIEHGLTRAQATELLKFGVCKLIKELPTKINFFTELDEVRQGVLINMAFNLGVAGLLKFKNTLALIQGGITTGNYSAASHGMLNSLWAKQVGRRAVRLSKQMQTGVWQV